MSENLMNSAHKATNDTFRKHYDITFKKDICSCCGKKIKSDKERHPDYPAIHEKCGEEWLKEMDKKGWDKR